MDEQEKKEFQAYLETLSKADREYASRMAARGTSLEDIKYYIDL